MPVYEFYCKDCNTVFKFFSRTINTEKIPACPKCPNLQLSRKVSSFATISSACASETDGPGMPPMDESKMEKAMEMLAREAGSMNEDDPRQAAALMRKLSDATGMTMGAGMEEALSRMEKGEDPDKIEEEMGDLLGGEEPFGFEEQSKGGSPRKSSPDIDDTIYDL